MMKFKRHINVAVVMFWVLFILEQDTGRVLKSIGVFKTKASCTAIAKGGNEANEHHKKMLFCAPSSVPINLPFPEDRK